MRYKRGFFAESIEFFEIIAETLIFVATHSYCTFPLCSDVVPVLVPEPDEPVEHDHVGVDLPGEHVELVRLGAEGGVLGLVAGPALHLGHCQQLGTS